MTVYNINGIPQEISIDELANKNDFFVTQNQIGDSMGGDFFVKPEGPGLAIALRTRSYHCC